MERIVLANYCAVFCVIALLLEVALSSVPNQYETDVNSKDKKDDDKQSSYLWFGPRLGRKKRDPDDFFYRSLELDKDQLAPLLNSFQEFSCIVVPLNGKKRPINFSPSHGRDLEEDFVGNYRWPSRLGRENDRNQF